MDELAGMMPSSANTGFANGNACIIFYSPRIYGTQVLRPYAYNITGNTIDKLACGGATMKDAISKKDIATHPDVAGAIQPTGNGTPLDMNVANQSWTFTLMVDIASPWLSGSALSGAQARRRIICSGVCLDEPVSPITRYSGYPTYNDNCHLRITHASEMALDPGISPAGNTTKTIIRSDMDIVGNEMQKCSPTDLYVGTPDKVLACNDPSSGISTEGLASLANLHQGTGIISNLKAPISHLRQLCMGLDQQVGLYEASGPLGVANPITDERNVFDVDQFKSGVVSEWSQMSSGANYTTGGIRTGQIVSLGALKKMYPALNNPQNIYKMELRPMSDVMVAGGVGDQTYTDPKTVYSSMVASAISTLAVNFGFDLIDFSYDSSGDQFSGAMGSFQVRDCRLLMQPSDPAAAKYMCANALEMFKRQLEIDLVPCILAGNNGHFQMNVNYVRNGDTVVDLNFYDWASLAGNGVFESPNRIGNTGSTSIVTGQQFIHNGNMLDILVHNVYGKNIRNQFGVTAFGGQDQGDMINTLVPEQPIVNPNAATAPIVNPNFY